MERRFNHVRFKRTRPVIQKNQHCQLCLLRENSNTAAGKFVQLKLFYLLFYHNNIESHFNNFCVVSILRGIRELIGC